MSDSIPMPSAMKYECVLIVVCLISEYDILSLLKSYNSENSKMKFDHASLEEIATLRIITETWSKTLPLNQADTYARSSKQWPMDNPVCCF